jgi:hypothetical protein
VVFSKRSTSPAANVNAAPLDDALSLALLWRRQLSRSAADKDRANQGFIWFACYLRVVQTWSEEMDKGRANL